MWSSIGKFWSVKKKAAKKKTGKETTQNTRIIGKPSVFMR
jgi:hypothetical protein